MTVPERRRRARRRRSLRSVVALLLLGVVAAIASPVSAVPAGALATAALPTPPRNAWWYTELDLPHAWQVSQGAGVTVAVLDSGVKAGVGDLRGQVLAGKDFTRQPGPATVDRGTQGSPLFGHGTDMAAMIAGTGRGSGLIGVAPKATILPVRVYAGAFADIPVAAGIRWAVDHGADIINMSLGGHGACLPGEQRAVDYAVRHGVLLVAATGNDPEPIGEPAACVGVIAVGALADSAYFQAWSQEGYGPQLDFVAPGQHLVAELLNGQLSTPTSNGTSQATAIVSGVFALLRSAFPHASPRDLVTRALYSVHNGLGTRRFGTRIDDRLGYGEILPDYALRHAPPAGAVNPIFDRIQRHLAAGGPVAPTPESPGSPGAGTSSAAGPGTRTSPPAASSPAAASGSSGGNTGVIAGVVVAVVVVAGGTGLLLARRRSADPRRSS